MDYRKRMTEYYPQVIRDCRDMQSIIFAEYPEFELFASHRDDVSEQVFLDTMSERRIEQWEKLLGITVSPTATLEERRGVIIGKLHEPGKLNEQIIKDIVNSMTKGTATVSFSDGVLHVEITPAANDGMELYPEVDKELSKRIPAHIRLDVSRALATWNTVKTTNNSWADVKNKFQSWRYVKTIVPTQR